ncbi:unnamed protein product [Euphydryas editha]|uniref:FLYWCH-type domain-containing protein n=1 Tax=Euphydryas editha TaxID=104508 RepID=A0AAU9TGE5_EUPED|nr:unnamed protein product [Euphydryas editha]
MAMFYIFAIKWVFKDTGKELAIVNGFTFYKHKQMQRTNTWSCTRGSPCNARIIVTNDTTRMVTRKYLIHNHKPPNFIIEDGMYIRI